MRTWDLSLKAGEWVEEAGAGSGVVRVGRRSRRVRRCISRVVSVVGGGGGWWMCG